MVFKPTDEEFAAVIHRKPALTSLIERKKLADHLESAAELVRYDHELKSEYLTDDERQMIIDALRK